MMNRNSATLTTTMLASGIVLTLAHIEREDSLPEMRQFIGLGVAFFFLSLMNDLGAEEVASGLALLLLVTVFTAEGIPALRYVFGKYGKTKQDKRLARRERAQMNTELRIAGEKYDSSLPLVFPGL